MKIKKLMSIGAIALTLACSTSIGASAAQTNLSSADLQKTLKKMIVTEYAEQYLKGNVKSLSKNTTIKDVLGDDANTIKGYLDDYGFGNQVLDKYDLGTTLGDGLDAINQKNLDTLQGKSKTISQNEKLQYIKNNQNDRVIKERDIKNIITNMNKRLFKDGNNHIDVLFGKNISGEITSTITQNGKVILQIDIDDLKTALDTFNGTDLSYIKGQKDELKNDKTTAEKDQ